MISFPIVLLILALICFVLAAMTLPTGRLNLVALGLAFWVLSILVGGAHFPFR